MGELAVVKVQLGWIMRESSNAVVLESEMMLYAERAKKK